MKQNELKAILEDESLSIADKMAKIQALNGQDIGKEQSKYQASIDTLQEENATLKTQVDQANSKLAGFEDYEELKKFKADSLAKVENERKTQFLASLGCKHPELLEAKVDWTTLTFNEENNTFEGEGLEAVKGLSTKYPTLFGEGNNAKPTPTPVVIPSSGQSTAGQMDAFTEAFYKRHPEYLKK